MNSFCSLQSIALIKPPKTSTGPLYPNLTVIPITGVNFNSNTFTVTGQTPSIRNGVYTCLFSTCFQPGAFDAYNTFSDTPGSFWGSNILYSNGNYTGSNSLGGASGEWIQIVLPYAFKLNNYTVQATTYMPRAIINHYLLGSTNGSSWTTLDTQLNQTPTSNPVTFTPSPISTSYKYYALVVGKLNTGGDLAAVQRLTLVGDYP